jgi:hypothetical protein
MLETGTASKQCKRFRFFHFLIFFEIIHWHTIHNRMSRLATFRPSIKFSEGFICAIVSGNEYIFLPPKSLWIKHYSDNGTMVFAACMCSVCEAFCNLCRYRKLPGLPQVKKRRCSPEIAIKRGTLPNRYCSKLTKIACYEI